MGLQRRAGDPSAAQPEAEIGAALPVGIEAERCLDAMRVKAAEQLGGGRGAGPGESDGGCKRENRSHQGSGEKGSPLHGLGYGT